MKFLVSIITALFLATGCTSPGKELPKETELTPEVIEPLTETIPELPEEMPEDFDICFRYWIGGENILDTYEGYIQKDLVIDGTVRTDYAPAEEEMQAIYDLVLAYELDSIDREMTSKVLTTDDTTLAIEPCTYYDIRFTADGKEYHIVGDETAFGYRESDGDAEYFCAFVTEMKKVLHETYEYQSLPEPEGGYM